MNKQPSDITWVFTLLVGFVLGFFLGLAVGWPADSCELPADPVQRVAIKALRGDFRLLEDWQQWGYEKLLRVEPKKRLAWVTCYTAGEPGVNHTTASGMPVSRRVAAMIDVPFGTYVLLDLSPAGFELRMVYDRGSRRNISRARSKGAETWVDRYLEHRSLRSWVRPIYLF